MAGTFKVTAKTPDGKVKHNTMNHIKYNNKLMRAWTARFPDIFFVSQAMEFIFVCILTR